MFKILKLSFLLIVLNVSSYAQEPEFETDDIKEFIDIL
jgi:hypothetical protein